MQLRRILEFLLLDGEPPNNPAIAGNKKDTFPHQVCLDMSYPREQHER